MTLYAQVAVLSGSPHRGSFTYAVPDTLRLRRGVPVIVPWRSQYALGIVLAIESESDYDSPRDVHGVLDDRPILTSIQLDLAAWIAERYLAPIADCVVLFLPPGAPRRPRRSPSAFRSLVPKRPSTPVRLRAALDPLELSQVLDQWPQSRRSRPAALLEVLQAGPIDQIQAARLLGGRHALARWLSTTTLASASGDELQLEVSAQEAAEVARSLRRTAAERRQLRLLRQVASDDLDETHALRSSGATAADVTLLEELGYLERVRVPHDQAESGAPESAPELTDAQTVAVAALSDALGAVSGSVHLLHGITGSGKTEVYLAATARASKRAVA